MGGMHGFGPVVVPGSRRGVPRALGGAHVRDLDARRHRRARQRRRARRFERRWSRSTTFAPRTTSAGSGAPSSGSCARARSRRARSTRGSNGCATGERMPQSSDPEQAARDRAAISAMRAARRSRPRRGSRPAIACACDDGATRGTRAALGTSAAPKGSSTRCAAPPRCPTSGRTPGRSSPSMRCRSAPTTVFGASDEVQWTVMLDLSETYLEPA